MKCETCKFFKKYDSQKGFGCCTNIDAIPIFKSIDSFHPFKIKEKDLKSCNIWYKK